MAAGLYNITNEKLGKGHFAVVKLARHCLTGELVAVKIVDKLRFPNVYLQQLGLEIKVLSRLSEKEHPNIVKLYQVIDTKNKLYLVMEYSGKNVCDLCDYIQKNNNGNGLKETEARSIFRQICSAIKYCHSLRIVHRDLKPENILIVEPEDDENVERRSEPRVKLIDFGFSNQWCEGEKLSTSCGSLAYSAPEILLGDHYDGDKVDIWGLGCILYTLLYGKNPFMQINDSETLVRILDCNFSTPRRASIKESSISLIKALLKRDPMLRLTLDQILDHPWLYENGEDKETLNGECDDGLIMRSVDEEAENMEPSQSTIHDQVIDHMISRGMCESKDHVEKALKKTCDIVNRTKSSELITSPNETANIGDSGLSDNTAADSGNNERSLVNDNETRGGTTDNYMTATYRLLKDKLSREQAAAAAMAATALNASNSTGGVVDARRRSPLIDENVLRSTREVESSHLKKLLANRPRKTLNSIGSRLRPGVSSPQSKSDNSQSVAEQVEPVKSVLELSEDECFVLPLARKCSIVSEEGSCAGTDISSHDNCSERISESERSEMISNSSKTPSVDIIVTDFSEQASSVSVSEPLLEEEDDEITIVNGVSKTVEHRDRDEILFDIIPNSKKECIFTHPPLHMVSSSPELLVDDERSISGGGDYLASVGNAKPGMIINDNAKATNDIDAHLKNIASQKIAAAAASSASSSACVSTTGSPGNMCDFVDGGRTAAAKTGSAMAATISPLIGIGGHPSSATSMRVIVQSKSCNNILLTESSERHWSDVWRRNKNSMDTGFDSRHASRKSQSNGSNVTGNGGNNGKVACIMKRKNEKAECCIVF